MSTFHGFCDDAGKFTLDYPRAFTAYVSRFKGEEVTIEVYKRRTKRSDKQNRAWHAALTPWADFLGYDIEELKDELLGIVFGYHEVTSPVSGEVRQVLAEPHSSRLDTQKFALLMERTVEIAAGTGFVIELPDEWKQRRPRERRRAA